MEGTDFALICPVPRTPGRTLTPFPMPVDHARMNGDGRTRNMLTITKSFPGVALAAGLAVVALFLGRLAPVIGGPVFGIVIGVVLAATLGRHLARSLPGVAFASTQILQCSIVLLGATLNLGDVMRASSGSLPVMLGTLAVCLGLAALVGPRLGLDRALQTLIGVGTAICGASAIAAVSAVTDATDGDIAYAISTIFVYNIAAVLVFPAVGHALSLSQSAFALWAGTAINDTSSVVAASFAYGPTAGDEAVIVKLTRTLLIVPIVVVLAVRRSRTQRNSGIPWRTLFPAFIGWFIAAVGLNTAGIIPPGAHAGLSSLALFLIIVALVAVGLRSNFEQMRRTGVRPLLFGGLLWVVVSLSSLTLQHLFGR
jgi:uncharacterized integral membrane protein (TIGR00698 family)